MISDEQKQIVERIVNEKIETIKAMYESQISQLKAHAQSLQADLLHLQGQRAKLHENENTGRYTMHANANFGSTALSKEDYAQVLPARLEMATLEEIVVAQAVDEGINVYDDAQWRRYCKLDDMVSKD
jgi:hypothetical protein